MARSICHSGAATGCGVNMLLRNRSCCVHSSILLLVLLSVETKGNEYAGQGSYENRTQHGQPNFVVIFADDMGWGDMGANWPQTLDTPNLDSLSKDGLRMTDFHAGASLCTPSRGALLTGRLGLRTGLIKNFGNQAIGGIPVNETTIGEMLKSHGYRTGMIGKWHLGVAPGHHPLDKGFDHWLGVPYSVDMGCADPPGENLPQCAPCPRERLENNDLFPLECTEDLALPLFQDKSIIHQPAPLKNLSTLYGDFAEFFILNSDARPFLFYAALSHMHVPLAHAESFDNVTGRGTYADTLREMDSLVGRIREAVDKRGSNDTLIWFLSDNGPWEVKCDLGGSWGPFEGSWQRSKEGGGGGSASKQTVWEAGHRVPSVVYWPGVIKAGKVSKALSSSLDILPTFAAFSGAALPEYRHFDGKDITDVLTGVSQKGHRFLYHPNSGASGNPGEIGAVRMGNYKMVYYTGGSPDCQGVKPPPRALTPPLLFNVAEDREESSPIDPRSKEYSKAALKIRQALDNFMNDVRHDNTSHVEYHGKSTGKPCCNEEDPICRCPWD